MAQVTIKQMREKAGITQGQLLAGCPFEYMDKSLLSKIENGYCLPSDEFLAYVTGVCGLTDEETLRNENNKVATAETRRAAYKALDKHGRKMKILALLENRELTAREIANILGFTERNAAAPRLTELMQRGLVEVIAKKKDSITNTNVSVYRRVK